MPNRLLRILVPCCIFCFTLAGAFAQDSWLGGAGFWSNASQWSLGVPTSSSDVLISSGSYDSVFLDVGSSTVNSLTLGA